jgi:transposase InsO family protein
MRPYHIAAFWSAFDSPDLSLAQRSDNSSHMALFTFDVVKSVSERKRDFLIHARLAHLPSKQILKLIKQGNVGLPFSGKSHELCRPCLEARQKANSKGKHAKRNADGKIGEHLHSDLASVSTADYFGFNYLLTVVVEISDEVVVVLLKNKTVEITLDACKRARALITSRAQSTLKTWQFDRGSEFMNKLFDTWIHSELGAKQLFSNIEHPWENGIAERSFQTIFSKARSTSMMKHADLPHGTWSKAVLHAVFLKNRSPATSTGVSPVQFRTGKPFNFAPLRVFGCPAQIFVRPRDRSNPKLSDRSEKKGHS